jgi:G3E family GTPase
MQLLLTTGFLGSGKTTFTIQLVQAAISAGKKVAILVNEVGEIGIDNQLMRQLDMNVWEMVNGCICCTLSIDLVSTLHKIDAEYDVDLVILEPSGIAEPSNILSALPYYKGTPLKSIQCVSILDPLRMHILIQAVTPLITKQIENSNLIIINKADLASEDEINETMQIAENIAPDTKILITSLKEPLEPALIDGLLH